MASLDVETFDVRGEHMARDVLAGREQSRTSEKHGESIQPATTLSAAFSNRS